MRLLLLKLLFLKKQFNLLKKWFKKSFQKINSFDFILDLILLFSKLSKGMVVGAKKCVLLLVKDFVSFTLLLDLILNSTLDFFPLIKKNRKNTYTKKILYSF